MEEKKLNEKELFENGLFRDLKKMVGEEVLIITQATQLDLFGQVFRPIFCGTISEVGLGHVTLNPVTIKMVNAPFYKFPTPLSIPLEKISSFSTGIGCDTILPLS